MGPNFARKYKIVFVTPDGREEPGIDGGGLFKEFISEVFKLVTSDSYGFFLENKADRTFYPNPRAVDIPHFEEHFMFMGMLVGKAIQMGVLVPIDFARFFMNLLV